MRGFGRITPMVLATLAAMVCLRLRADEFNDGIDRTDPKFVKASLLVFGPGDTLFACVGHCAIRLECPKFKLDNCFSCESEPIDGNWFKLLMGNMTMGMYAVPTDEFLKFYVESGRKCTQYEMNLPPEVKQRLWKILDEKVQRGPVLHYDYIKYSCAQSILYPILEAIRPLPIMFPAWPEKFELTRREILVLDLWECKWTSAFLHTIAGTEVDRDVSHLESVILPPDLLWLLQHSKILGQNVITDPGTVLLSYQAPGLRRYFTPMVLAGAFLALAVFDLFVRRCEIAWLFLAVQSILGLLMFHLLFISNLPATEWNWLVIPFNPLPILLWRWRRHWARPFAVVLVAWELGMMLSPHLLTDFAYYVFVFAYVLFWGFIAADDRPAFRWMRGAENLNENLKRK